jgi:hypothetical protein
MFFSYYFERTCVAIVCGGGDVPVDTDTARPRGISGGCAGISLVGDVEVAVDIDGPLTARGGRSLAGDVPWDTEIVRFAGDGS